MMVQIFQNDGNEKSIQIGCFLIVLLQIVKE
ncbi:hypothetical protein J560_4536, partial [Acinetobacter baumannii 855125]